MARMVSTQERPEAANPAIFGQDVASSAWQAVGIALSSMGNDRIVGPLVRQAVPISPGGEVGAKLLDAGTTFLTGFGLSKAISVVSRSVGVQVLRGAVVLGMAKVLGAAIPGFGVSASFPAVPGVPSLAPAPAPKELPKGSDDTVQDTFPRPVAASMFAGL